MLFNNNPCIGLMSPSNDTSLQVLGSRQEVLLDSFLAIMPEGSAADFAKVLDVRAVRKPEAQQLMEAYSKRTGRGAGGPRAHPQQPAAAGALVRSAPQLGMLGTSFTVTGAGGSAQDLAARLRLGTAGATARASTGMRDTMNAMRAMGLRLREASFRQ